MSETTDPVENADAHAHTNANAPANALAEHVRVVRLGHGANCSSLGSVVDMLFATAVVGGALFAAIASALEDEPVTRVLPPVDAPPGDVREGDARKDDAP